MTKIIDWDEINSIIMDRSSKQSYMVIPNEMNLKELEKIRFLLSEINRFPDSQKTVSESSAIFREYLSDKYCKLSTENVDRLVHRFCYLNK